MACEICEKIAASMRDYVDGDEALASPKLRTISRRQDLEQSSLTCVDCQILWHHLLLANQHSKFNPNGLLLTIGGSNYEHVPVVMVSLRLARNQFDGVSRSILRLLPSKLHDKQDLYFTGVSAKIDVQRIRQWATICETSHGMECQPSLDGLILPLPSDLILIDTHDSCLVESSDPGSVRYLCLSYVWGDISTTLQTTVTTLSALKQKNALKERWNSIPSTIRDAITVAQRLDFRYLWVDQFCIIQDSIDHKARQIQHMAGIYSNAIFTICATDGAHADAGLAGVVEPRPYTQKVLRFGSSVAAAMISEHLEDTSTSWYSRGWTFQERLLSTRQVVFNKEVVKWRCKKAHCSELVSDSRMPLESKAPQRFRKNLSNLPVRPHFQDYVYLSEGFSQRKLSREQDMLNAFGGVLAALSTPMQSEFHFGLPMNMLDFGMLWINIPDENDEESRRTLFPSWSWLGWRGKLRWAVVDEFYLPTMHRLWHLEPVAVWERITNSGERELIPNAYLEWTKYLKNFDFEPPEGWTRIVEPIKTGDPNGSARDNSRVSYAHSHITPADLGYNANDKFCHPVPTSQIPLPTPKFSSWTPYLRCHCQVQKFKVVPKASKRQAWSCDIQSLEDDTTIGKAHPDSAGPLEGTADWLFAAISRKGRYQSSEPGRFNLLWIQVRDGIAYRVGLGQMLEKVWLSLNPSKSDLTLG